MSVTVKASLIICLMLRLLCAQAQDAYQFSGMLDYGYYSGYDGKSQFGSISRNNVAFDANKQINRDLSLTLKLSTRFF